jgi:hypothetical protein
MHGATIKIIHGIRFQMAVNFSLIAMRTTYHVYSNAG